MVYHVTVTFSWCLKVHFGSFSLKCKSCIISIVFVIVYLVIVTFSWFFKVHFEFLSLKCKSWNISVVFCRGLPSHSYILLIFQSSFWISFVEMQELEYFSSVLLWFTLSQLHSIDFSKFIFRFLSLKCKSWNISVVFSYGLPCHS